MFASPGQRLIFDILTMVITADTKEQLEADTDALSPLAFG